MRGHHVVALADHCELITKGTTPSTLGLPMGDQGVPFLRAQNIVDGGVSIDVDPLFITLDTHRVLKRSQIESGDVLISIAGTIGRVGIVPPGVKAMNCNQAVAIIRPKPNIYGRFLLHWLSSTSAKSQINKSKVTATISNLSLSQIGNLEIPLPPLDEQRRIAAILDKADALRRKRKRALELLDGYPQAVFLEMFGDPTVNGGRSHKTAALAEVAEIGSGITKGRNPPSEPLRQVPYLAVANVQDRALDLSTVKTIEASEAEINRYRLQCGDLVLTEGGDPDKLGRGTVWNNELPEVIHQNHIFRVRVHKRDVDPLYLNYLVGSRYGKNYFLRSAKQTTGIASINKSQLSAFPVLLPPIELQKNFSSELMKLKDLRDRINSSQINVEALFTSLQHRAFSGQL